jgi:hypothetical protein
MRKSLGIIVFLEKKIGIFFSEKIFGNFFFWIFFKKFYWGIFFGFFSMKTRSVAEQPASLYKYRFQDF